MSDKPKLSAAEKIARLDRWISLTQEEALEPSLPIIDPHHHLWNRGGHDYRLAQFRRETDSGHDIRGSIYVECLNRYREDGPEEMRVLGETDFVMQQAGDQGPDDAPLLQGIIGHADLMLGSAVGAVLDAQIEAGRGRFKGIRFATAFEASDAVHASYRTVPHMLADARLREGFAELGKRGLTFDAWLYHPQLNEVLSLADAFPETKIIIDHCGGPIRVGPYESRRDDVYSGWLASMRALALRPNVCMKIGGLGMRMGGFGFFARETPASSAEIAQAYRPFVEPLIEVFGVRRCMFESNFPVDRITCSYGILWNVFKRLAGGASAPEKAGLFAESANEVYRLGIRL
jgi:predicted TIM-barrel fold metal-dependent hydrolase